MEFEPGSFEHKREVFLARKADAIRISDILEPYLREKYDKADEQERSTVKIDLSILSDVHSALVFLANIPKYEQMGVTEAAAEQRGYERAKKDAAQQAREKADAIRKANTYRGRVNDNAEQAAVWCDEIAAAIGEMK